MKKIYKLIIIPILAFFCISILYLSCELLENKPDITEPLSAEEYPLGDIPLSKAKYSKFMKILPIKKAALLTAYDARNSGIVTTAKNQSYCASCWAFASAGALESHLIMSYPNTFNSTIDLSEQQQVSCNTNMSGCLGGDSNAINFWQNTGPSLESCFPYTASGSTPCSYCSNYTHEIVYDYRISNYHTVSTSDVNQVKTSLYEEGPTYFRFDVYTDFDSYWNTGSSGSVYVNQTGTFRGGHAVLIIGWDNARDAYLCKNSWGESAGPNDDGTFWIAYSGHVNNLEFGMANFQVNLPCDPRPCKPNTCVECSLNTCPD